MAGSSTVHLFLKYRLRIVEDIWESVLQQECGPEFVDLLKHLLADCSPDGNVQTGGNDTLALIEDLDLNDAIRATRAFALYFQLINIVEQHYEQLGEQKQYEAAYERVADGDRATQSFFTVDSVPSYIDPESSDSEANLLTRGLQETSQYRREARTFQGMFPKLKRLNVPPQHIQNLMDKLDVRLVFTAHPTEIVRHTIRGKQRRIAKILRQLDRVEEGLHPSAISTSFETNALRQQLTEEIRLWWRTDELHQFKPTVLDEVDFTLHYFEEVLFDTIPELYQRFCSALHTTFPHLQPPSYDF
ncbi:MAG: phosphoenolpyruvate carboxylase [Symploca sp. SIO2B6]|nr:phosphoenolpyruvate carboxylase [Symploca sp. SIO2B6]